MTCEEWDETFGKVYKGMIDAGVQSVMVGHIALPSYSRKLCPGIRDEDIMPATISKELFNRSAPRAAGIQWSHHYGCHPYGRTYIKMKRSEFVPYVIEAGCDMVLYYRDKDEDVENFKAGLESGLLSREAL